MTRWRSRHLLPAPNGLLSLYMRAYWSDQAVIDGTWTPPAIRQLR